MKKIEVFNIIIQLDLFEDEKFLSLNRYLTDKTPEYFITSNNFSNFDIPFYEPKLRTEFYDLYEIDSKTIQVQKTEGNIIGGIVYDGNKINIYPRIISFELEYLLSQYAFSYIISKKGGLIFHASSFIYKDKGILISAKSGTGKSTHTSLWEKYENVQVLNDDKNILFINDNNELYMTSSPWSGKHMKDNNLCHRVDLIVFLYQNKENVIETTSMNFAFRKLIVQLQKPTEENRDIWENIFNHLLETKSYTLGCTKEKEAYLCLKERIDDELCH